MAIKLEKQGDSHKINLQKNAKSSALKVHVNFDWEEQKKGWFQTSSQADLDLGCMYEMQSGEKGVIQPLGNNFGSKQSLPYIFLDKDDRTGATAGENMYVFRPDLIKKVMFFGFIYRGASDFKSVKARMFINVENSDQIYFELDNPQANLTFCAAGLLKNENNQLIIQKEERYFRSHKEADQYYGFGFQWTTGSK
jgi:tellurite resistance protein TerA